MANELQTGTEPSLAVLMKGIVQDVQVLIKQQVALTKREIQEDLRKTRDAALMLAIGAGVAALSVILLCLALPHLLVWIWPELPLWAGYVIVGGVLAALGGVLVYAGIRQFQSFNPLPDESLDALKENVQWITNPK